MSGGHRASPVLLVSGLTKSYAGRPVVEDVSFAVEAGQVVALRGPNGAGKTTVLRCLTGVERPDAGVVTFDGQPLDERDVRVRRDVATVFDDMGWFPDVTAAEHLDVFARAHGCLEPELLVRHALRALAIEDVADQLPATLSSGQRRRLALATTLVRPFRLLLLDEPEQRLDVAGRSWVARYLRDCAGSGAAVLLASHDDTLVGAVAARVVPIEPHG